MLDNITSTTNTEDVFISFFKSTCNTRDNGVCDVEKSLAELVQNGNASSEGTASVSASPHCIGDSTAASDVDNEHENCSNINNNGLAFHEDDTDFSLAPSSIIDHHNQFNHFTHLDVQTPSILHDTTQDVENFSIFEPVGNDYAHDNTPSLTLNRASAGYNTNALEEASLLQPINSLSTFTSNASATPMSNSTAEDDMLYSYNNYFPYSAAHKSSSKSSTLQPPPSSAASTVSSTFDLQSSRMTSFSSGSSVSLSSPFQYKDVYGTHETNTDISTLSMHDIMPMHVFMQSTTTPTITKTHPIYHNSHSTAGDNLQGVVSTSSNNLHTLHSSNNNGQLHPLMNAYLPTNATTGTTTAFSAARDVVDGEGDSVSMNSSYGCTTPGINPSTSNSKPKSKFTNVVLMASPQTKRQRKTGKPTNENNAGHTIGGLDSGLNNDVVITGDVVHDNDKTSTNSSISPASLSLIRTVGHAVYTKDKKISDSRLSAEALARVLNLQSADEAREIEKFVLECLSQRCGFPLGYKTWVRDTTKTEREVILNKLYLMVKPQYPQYSIEILEKIIRRATYYMMQSRLRRERRAKVKAQKRELLQQERALSNIL
ncbi:hypothetical protein ACO0QE_003326 [Hanseniaspora vineae]